MQYVLAPGLHTMRWKRTVFGDECVYLVWGINLIFFSLPADEHVWRNDRRVRQTVL